MKYSWPFLVISLMLAGCSTMSYTPPVSGPVAKVRFVTDNSSVTILRSYGDPACKTQELEMLRIRNGTLLGSGHQSLGIPGGERYREEAYQEILAAAGIPNHYMFYGNSTDGKYNYRCAVPFTGVFDEGKSYEVKFRYDGMTTCNVSVQEILADGQVLLLSKHDNNLTPLNQLCLSALKKPRLF